MLSAVMFAVKIVLCFVGLEIPLSILFNFETGVHEVASLCLPYLGM